MEPFNWNFDARTIEPQQGGGAHPVGNKFPFTITSVEVKATKENNGGMLKVELTSPAGSIVMNYNLWNESDKAREIAQKQLSALCHVTGIFVIGPRQGQELLGGKGLMDIGFQKGHEPTAEKPQGGYVELKKVYDSAGNEPGKPGAAQPTAQGGASQWAGGGNGAQPQNTNPANPSWSQGGQPQQQVNPQQQAVNNGPAVNSGWQQGNGQNAAPWKQ